MPTLTIRDVPESVLQGLKDLAKRNRRSMEQEAKAILASVSQDRLSVLRQIEESWKRQSRPTTPDEVQRWIEQSRP